MASSSSPKEDPPAGTATGSETESSSRSLDSDKSSGDGSGIHGQNVPSKASDSSSDHEPVTESGSSSSTATGDLLIALDMIQSAWKAFKSLDFAAAANLYKLAVEIMLEQYDEFAPELALAYHKYGLALMYDVAVPMKDDLLAILPMEVDYLLHNGKDGFISPEQHVDRLLENQSSPDDDVRWRDSLKNLEKAWSIVENQAGLSEEKVDILSALGELEFRQGRVNSYKYYQRALVILENEAEPDNRRKAVLNFKICVQLTDSHRFEEATYHCQKGLSLCETLIEKIEDESKGLPDGDPSTQQKKTEVSRLTIVFEILLQKLQERLSSSRIPTPPAHSPSSVNQQIASPTQLGAIKDNQPQQESPTSSTANTNKRAAGSGGTGPTTDFSTETTSTDSSPSKHRKKGD